MTPEEINRTIARWRGWVIIQSPEIYEWSFIDPSGKGHDELPDFYNDLNAVHEAEKKLDDAPLDTRSLWYDYLGLVVGWKAAKSPDEARFECSYLSARATAPQRCEALLRAIGKWRDK